MLRKATNEEVLGLIDEESLKTLAFKVNDHDQIVVPLSLYKIVELIEKKLGERVSQIALERTLDHLVTAKSIRKLRGSHAVIRHTFGTVDTGYYYLGHDAFRIAADAKTKEDEEERGEKASVWASTKLIAAHEDEYRGLRMQYIYEHPTPTYD